MTAQGQGRTQRPRPCPANEGETRWYQIYQCPKCKFFEVKYPMMWCKLRQCQLGYPPIDGLKKSVPRCDKFVARQRGKK